MPSASDWRKDKRTRPKADNWRKPTGEHTFTVQKPFCCPARGMILQALTPYGVPVVREIEERMTGISIADYAKLMRIELKTFENLKYGPAAITFLPLAIQARVTVPASQAEWAEYLIERTGRLAVVGGKINAKNRGWADQHNGEMPTPWGVDMGKASALRRGSVFHPSDDNEAQIEAGCKQGHAIWKAVQEATKKGRR